MDSNTWRKQFGSTSKKRADGNFTVVGRDGDNNLICRPDDGGPDYNSGQTAEEFGVENLTVEEKRNIGLMRPLAPARNNYESGMGNNG